MENKIQFLMQAKSTPENVIFKKEMTNQEIENYFENACGEVYEWKRL